MSINFPGSGANSSPAGPELGAIVRGMLRKFTTVETTKPLPSAGVFTGPWHDTTIDGTMFVFASSISNQAGGSPTLIVQETDDPNTPNFTRTLNTAQVSGGGVAAANTIVTMGSTVRCRYWRLVYTNGATAQGTFILTATTSNVPLIQGGLALSGSGLGNNNNTTPVSFPGSFNTFGDNIANNGNVVSPTNMASGGGPLYASVNEARYGGSFTGTTDATRRGWSLARTSTVLRTVSTAAAGATAIWTPGTGNKFRLLQYDISVSGNAATAGGGVVTIKLQDAAADINVAFDVLLPNAATLVQGDAFVSPRIDLGTFGYLSTAVNQALTVNLSAALSAGNVRVNVAGTEE